METRGVSTPDTAAAAKERYDALGPAAKQVVKESTRAMEFDADEYETRVTPHVVAAARDVLFASLLTVYVGTTEEFDDWTADHPDYDIDQTGSENVDRVAWHPAHMADTVVATTFQSEPDAACASLRRQAWGRIYRDLFYTESNES